MHQTSPPGLDAAVETVRDRKDRWAALPVADRIILLRRASALTLAAAEDQVRAACEAKSLAFDSPASSEEWLSGPLPVVRTIRLLIETLTAIQRTGSPPIRPGAIRRRPNGQLAVEVVPASRIERFLYPGTRAEVWLEPDVAGRLKSAPTGAERAGRVQSAPTGAERAGRLQSVPTRDLGGGRLQPAQAGKVALVLAAGNVAAIGPTDVLHKLFVENQVCIVKMHPVNDYLGPFIERGFAPFVDEGYMRFVYGGPAEGAYLVHHPDVDEIHVTGSVATHDAIVWGDTPNDRARHKRAGTPQVQKRVTSELGCVTPVIVLPGAWSDRELDYQAQNVATMIAINASCNCNAAKTLMTWKAWPQRQAFLRRIEEILASLPPRTAYYPGSADKFAAFLRAHPEAKRLAEPSEGVIPWTSIFDVDSARAGDIVFCEEAWCPIIAETALAAGDEGQFLDEAVRFCNDRLWGTLSCTLIAHPKTQARLGDRFERAIETLRYGTVSVNHWCAIGFVFSVTPWGAAPGHTLQDVGSGIGMVHNPLMLDRPVKSVIRGPFTQCPRPIWFVTHRSAHIVARRMTEFEAQPSWRKLLPIAWHAMRA